ncbi:MAG: sulfite exporter TauE/SafE family protein, partial [Halomonas sp.]|nr:sulfite exporter TauE/SafE family protein [Halomonas sp.]
FEAILIAVMAASALVMLLPQPKLDTRPLTKERLTPLIYLAMFVIGIYGGFIQVGVGVLFIIVLYRMLKIDLAQVNVFKVLIILVYSLPALAMFMWFDQVRWSYGLLLAVGSMTGAWLAVKVNMSPRGAMWIKYLTLLMIAAILLRLLFG